MKPRKKVKKLILNKEDVVNLNENQMNSLKGGVGVVETIALSVGVVSIVYETGKDTSVWTCPPDSTNPPPQPSTKWVWVKTEQVCEISDAVVYAYP